MNSFFVHIDDIFDISSDQDFNEKALKIFRFQAENCDAYRLYLNLLKIDPATVNTVEQIPYLPIEVFKTRRVMVGDDIPELVFKSSGTTGQTRSHHYVNDPLLYERSFTEGFKQAYGNVEDYVILGLLPSYLEQGESSLVYMTHELINRSGHELSGFYLDEYDKLSEVLSHCSKENIPTILIGVTYALIDFAESHPMDLKNVIIMETGGMKGRRKEMIREEVHDLLKSSFNIVTVHSEYGMTELLSQAYSKGDGCFNCPPWMKIRFRENTDPVYSNPNLKSGIINVIDLANINSCSFIATQDLGKKIANGYEILGRTDHSDIRGCSQLTL